MTSTDGSAAEIPSSAAELELDYLNGWPGAPIVVHVRAKESNSNVSDMKVSLLTLTGNSISEALPHDGIAVLEIPRDCEPGDYSLCLFQGGWCLDSVPFEITSRRIAELTRMLLRASVLQADALAAAQDSLVDAEEVVRLASEVEHLYVACGEARWARRIWEEISDTFRDRGLQSEAREATDRARALEPKPQLRAIAAAPRTRPSTELPSNDVSRLYARYAPQLRFFLARQSRLKHKVEDLVQDVFVCLLRYPPTEELSRADNYLWRIAWRLVNAANRRAEEHRGQMTKLNIEAPDWLLGRSGTLSPTDVAEWLAYREQVRRCLEDLSPEVREAVLLARLGYSYDEIATRMDISVNSLRKHLRRGYLTLQTSKSSDDD
jgi:RNA polymerase sigma-70 factor (ECF subfamily)